MIIAIDGPAGSGKSSIAKKLAEKLNFTHLDTGAIYRVITLHFLNEKIDIDTLDDIELKNKLNEIELDIKKNTFFLNKKDVSKDIRTKIIDENVSKIASKKLVREYSTTLQKTIGNNGDYIVDGRDIGTVVFPDANLKFFLTASPEIRAKRRCKQNENNGTDNLNYQSILEDIKKRDKLDSNRKESPLKQADDAILIDTSNFSFNEVLKIILDKVENVE